LFAVDWPWMAVVLYYLLHRIISISDGCSFWETAVIRWCNWREAECSVSIIGFWVNIDALYCTLRVGIKKWHRTRFGVRIFAPMALKIRWCIFVNFAIKRLSYLCYTYVRCFKKRPLFGFFPNSLKWWSIYTKFVPVVAEEILIQNIATKCGSWLNIFGLSWRNADVIMCHWYKLDSLNWCCQLLPCFDGKLNLVR